MKFNLSDTHCKIFYESNAEFEEVRQLCLQEGTNWLSKNYNSDNLKIEDHSAYGVLYQTSTRKPMVMGGVYNNSTYPANVARIANRVYSFLDFRMTPSTMVDAHCCLCLLLNELMAVTDYDVYLITMQNRPARPKKGFWKGFYNSIQSASGNDWTMGDGYIQTCPWDVKNCWQNYIWKEITPGAYAKWDPTTINHNQWLLLDDGT